LQTRRKILTTENSSLQISIVNEVEKRMRESEKKNKATPSHEERGARSEKKGKEANAKESQHAEVTMRVTRTDAPYDDSRSDETLKKALRDPGRMTSKRKRKRRWKRKSKRKSLAKSLEG
jgi:hypothetical protein